MSAAAAAQAAGNTARRTMANDPWVNYKMAGKVAGVFSLMTPVTYAYAAKFYHNRDSTHPQNVPEGSDTIHRLRDARRDSLKDYKEQIYQGEDRQPTDYEHKSYDRYNATHIRRTKSYRPGGELSQFGSKAYAKQKSIGKSDLNTYEAKKAAAALKAEL